MKSKFKKFFTSHQKLSLFLVVFIAFLLLLLFNYIYPFTRDDLVYSRLLVKPAFLPLKLNLYDLMSDHKVSSLTDIFKSEYTHYMYWGGRVVVHTIDQLLLYIGFPYYRILNALAFIGLIVLTCRFINGSLNKYFKITFIFSFVLFFFLIPAFYDVFLWLTGAANYLWGSILLLSFLYPYQALFRSSDKPCSNESNIVRGTLLKLKPFYLFFGGLIAGCTNENTVCVALLFLFVFFLFLKRKQLKVPGWYYSGFFGMLIGYVFLLFAPGNFLRFKSELLRINVTQNQSFLHRLFIEKIGHGMALVVDLMPIIIIFVILLIVNLYSLKSKSKQSIRISIIYFLFMLISTLVLAAFPNVQPRALCCSTIFGIMSVLVLFNNLFIFNSLSSFFNHRFVPVLLCCFFLYYGIATKRLIMARKLFDVQVEAIKKAAKDKVASNNPVVINQAKPILVFKNIVNDFGLTDNPNIANNMMFAKYYHVHSCALKYDKEN